MALLEVFHVWLSMSIKRRYSRVYALIHTIDTHDTVSAQFLTHNYVHDSVSTLHPSLLSVCLFTCVCVCYPSFVFIFCVCVSVTKGQHGVELHWYVAQRSVSITHPSFFPWGKATKGTDRYICAYIEPLELERKTIIIYQSICSDFYFDSNWV